MDPWDRQTYVPCQIDSDSGEQVSYGVTRSVRCATCKLPPGVDHWTHAARQGEWQREWCIIREGIMLTRLTASPSLAAWCHNAPHTSANDQCYISVVRVSARFWRPH